MLSLLLHICCAPCSTQVIRSLAQEFAVTGYFYNPNIYPPDEYQKRLETMQQYATQLGIPLLFGRYDTTQWLEAVQGYEAEPEGGPRCTICYRFRLDQTAKQAKEAGFNYFATTLTISPHKPASVINQIGLELAEKYSVSFYPADFKKKDGFKQSCTLAKEFQLYRQTYCGCKYSLRK
ncbi:MAG: epoxyqueuosine reductase QueH [bacterium]|nr:epoxyqueuosine reductase QueH [bacterium]